MDELNDDTNHLFSYDIKDDSGVKCFIVGSRDNMYKHIGKGDMRFAYENYEKYDPVKLFVDIDINKKEIPKKADSRLKFFKDITDEVVDMINTKLIEYTNTVPEICIMSANREDKLSAHIIYTNIHFQTIEYQKFFFGGIKSYLLDRKILDPSNYNVGCFQMF